MIAETRSAQLARLARSLSVLSHNKNRACHSTSKAQLDSASLHLADWLSPDLSVVGSSRSAQLARLARSLSVLSHNKNRSCHAHGNKFPSPDRLYFCSARS